MSVNLDDYWDGLDVLYKSDVIGNFQFSMTVELVYDIPLRAVRNINKQNEYEHIHEGGLNDYVHMRRKPISQPFTFEVERYLTTSWTDPLSNGTELTLPVILWLDKWANDWCTNISEPDPSKRKYKHDSQSGKLFIFTGVIVMGKRYGEFNAEKPEVATEIITLGYNNLYVLSNYAALCGSPWE